jgi:hypothetical protein
VAPFSSDGLPSLEHSEESIPFPPGPSDSDQPPTSDSPEPSNVSETEPISSDAPQPSPTPESSQIDPSFQPPSLLHSEVSLDVPPDPSDTSTTPPTSETPDPSETVSDASDQPVSAGSPSFVLHSEVVIPDPP